MGGTGRVLLSLSLASPSTTRFSFSFLCSTKSLSLHNSLFPFLKPPANNRVLVGFRPLCSATAITTTTQSEDALQPIKHSVLLERLRVRHLKDSAKKPATVEVQSKKLKTDSLRDKSENERAKRSRKNVVLASSFEELGLSEEVIGALREMNISVPTEIQCIGIPGVLEGKSVVLGSHTGSGKTLAYMLPLIQVKSFYFYTCKRFPYSEDLDFFMK